MKLRYTKEDFANAFAMGCDEERAATLRWLQGQIIEFEGCTEDQRRLELVAEAIERGDHWPEVTE